MYGYTKLFSSILTSTIWQEDIETKIVWITLLALRDHRNIAEGSIPGLAHLAGVSIQACEHALEKLKAPDQYSRTKDHEGRRIEDVPGGWLILNGAKYCAKLSVEDRKEYKRQWQANYRAQKKGKGPSAREREYVKSIQDGSPDDRLLQS